MGKRIALVTLAIVLFIASCAQPESSPAPADGRSTPDVAPAEPTPTAAVPASLTGGDAALARFEEQLENLRQLLKIPGFSAAIVAEQELVWARGFGHADLEDGVEATPETPYRLASVTKPIAATLIMQLVEEGLLDLDEPVSTYGVELESEGVITVWHLLTHTSEGVPGTHHNYHGDRYSRLGAVVEGVTGQSFGEALDERILEPLGMTNTAPNLPACSFAGLAGMPELGERERSYARINEELASPYQLDSAYNIVTGAYPSGFSPAAGLISTVVDLAKFDVALDQGLLLGDEAKAQMFEPLVSTYGDRTDLMYGLGWYSQRTMGTRLLWHTGRWPPSASALYLKVPDWNLTFIILANTAYLTTPFPLGDGDILYSTLAETFYKTFVFPLQYGKQVPEIDWEASAVDLADQLAQITDDEVRQVLERELWSYRQLFASVGRTELVDRLQGVHGQVFSDSEVCELDLHAVRGVDYRPVVQAQAEPSKEQLGVYVGDYALVDTALARDALLPPAVSIQMVDGELYGVAAGAECISLVPITPTRFAIPESPGLSLEFHADGERVDRVTVEAGGMAAEYRPSESARGD